MVSKSNNYNPIFQFTGKHADILNRHTTSLVLTDSDGRQADNVRIQLTGINREGIPDINETIQLSLGYRDGEDVRLYDKGEFLISRPRLSLVQNTVTINGVSARFKPKDETAFDTKKIRTFQNKTVKEILTALIDPHGYTPIIDENLGSQVVTQFEQAESDHEAIYKLAEQFAAIAKPLGAFSGTYVFGPRGSNLTILENQKVARQYSLYPNNVIQSLELIAYSRDTYLGVECEWQCLDKAQMNTVRVGKPKYKYIGQRADEVSARQAAKAELKRMQMKGRRIRCTVIGDPELVTEGIASFDSTFPSQYRGDWSIDHVIHRLNSSGYTSVFTATLLIS